MNLHESYMAVPKMPALPIGDAKISTKRCTLLFPDSEQNEEKFSQAVWTASRVPGFTDGMQWEPPKSIEEVYARRPIMRQEWEEQQSYSFAVMRDDDNECIGCISIRCTESNEPGVYSIGFWVHPDVQGQKYGLEIVQAIIDFGFSTLDANEIQAACATWNEGSKRVLERVGMKENGIKEQGIMKKGKWVPEFELSIDRNNWKSGLQL